MDMDIEIKRLLGEIIELKEKVIKLKGELDFSIIEWKKRCKKNNALNDFLNYFSYDLNQIYLFKKLDNEPEKAEKFIYNLHKKMRKEINETRNNIYSYNLDFKGMGEEFENIKINFKQLDTEEELICIGMKIISDTLTILDDIFNSEDVSTIIWEELKEMIKNDDIQSVINFSKNVYDPYNIIKLFIEAGTELEERDDEDILIKIIDTISSDIAIPKNGLSYPDDVDLIEKYLFFLNYFECKDTKITAIKKMNFCCRYWSSYGFIYSKLRVLAERLNIDLDEL